MDDSLRKELYVWTYNKIKDNPKRFGGDLSNSLIMLEYLKDFHKNSIVNDLNYNVMKVVSTISRIKNKLLENNPHFDYRVRYKRKSKSLSK